MTNMSSDGKTPLSKEMVEKILNTAKLKKLNLPQDYVDGCMAYGLTIEGEDYIITSQKELISKTDLSTQGFVTIQETLLNSNFPVDLSIDFINNDAEIEFMQVYNLIYTYIKRYIYFSKESYYVLATLWVMGTYVFRIFMHYPYIHLRATKESGKSTLMSVLAPICFNGSLSVVSSPAVIYREIEATSGTLMLDEFDRIKKSKNESESTLSDIIKTGFEKNGSVKKCIGKDFDVKQFCSYSPKIIASIEELDDIIKDRVITIDMKRKLQDDGLEKYIQMKAVKTQEKIRRDLYLFGLQFGGAIAASYE